MKRERERAFRIWDQQFGTDIYIYIIYIIYIYIIYISDTHTHIFTPAHNLKSVKFGFPALALANSNAYQRDAVWIHSIQVLYKRPVWFLKKVNKHLKTRHAANVNMDSMQVPVQFHRSVCWAAPTGAKFDTQEGGNRDSHTQTIMIGVVTSVTPGWWICLREFHRKSSKCMWKSMVSGFVIKVHGWFEKRIPFHTLIGSFLICFPPHWMTICNRIAWEGFDHPRLQPEVNEADEGASKWLDATFNCDEVKIVGVQRTADAGDFYGIEPSKER